MKRIVSIILVLTLICCMIPTAFAASSEATEAADALHNLGLFNGTGTDANGNPIYDLDRAPSRSEAVTMLVRLLGKESEAKAGTWETPFADVQDWAKPYVGYAYANKLTSGTSATTFGGSSVMTATQYITLVLRALGYESGTDFQWDKAWELSDKIGMTDGRYNANSNGFLRGDVAIVSNNALDITLKNSASSLRDTLKLPEESSEYEQVAKRCENEWGMVYADAEYYKNGDEVYKLKSNSSVGTTFYKYTVNGVTKDYIDADFGATAFLSVIFGAAQFQKSNNPNLAYELKENGGILFLGREDGWTMLGGNGFVSASKTETVTDTSNPLSTKTKDIKLIKYTANGKSITFDVSNLNTGWDDIAYRVDGVTCIKSRTAVYVCAQELLDYLGIEGTLQIEKDSYGNIIYSVN